MTLRTLPSQGLFFMVYENSKRKMSKFLNIPYPADSNRKESK